jgi:hypothetical protein
LGISGPAGTGFESMGLAASLHPEVTRIDIQILQTNIAKCILGVVIIFFRAAKINFINNKYK